MSEHFIVLEEPFRTLWSGRDPFVEVEMLKGEVFRELEARRTLRTEIAGRGYFVKIHRGVGWREILKNLLCLRLPILGAANEWQAIQKLKQLNVGTMHGVAFGQRGRNPATKHSFIITEELSPTISLEDFCKDWPENPPSITLKRTLIRQVADMARRMHGGGVNHRDFYICHFLLHLDPSPTPVHLKLSLIDLHRAQIRERTPRRWRDKDLASLYFSALDVGLTQRDIMRFLRVYFDLPLRTILEQEARTLAELTQEADRLMDRYRKKYAKKPVP